MSGADQQEREESKLAAVDEAAGDDPGGDEPASGSGGSSLVGAVKLLAGVALIAAIAIGVGLMMRSLETESELRGQLGELQAQLETVRGELEAERAHSAQLESRLGEVGELSESLGETFARLRAVLAGEPADPETAAAAGPAGAAAADEVDPAVAEETEAAEPLPGPVEEAGSPATSGGEGEGSIEREVPVADELDAAADAAGHAGDAPGFEPVTDEEPIVPVPDLLIDAFDGAATAPVGVPATGEVVVEEPEDDGRSRPGPDAR